VKIEIKNWKKFQHYSHRNPPWVKLHKTLLDDYIFNCLTDASKVLAMRLWLIASEYEGGIIESTYEQIAFRLRSADIVLATCLQELEVAGFIVVSDYASTMLATCLRDATTETETETEKSKSIALFALGTEKVVSPKIKPKAKIQDEPSKPYSEIIADLNKKGGFRYKDCDSTRTIINGRLSEGFEKEDFFQVHTNMISEWAEDPKYSKYLRPETLYQASKFQGYLNLKTTTKPSFMAGVC